MGLFDWLFGRAEKPVTESEIWTPSENGNPMIVSGTTRITVFPQDRGWKYCIAEIDDRREPIFSEVYGSERAAKDEALAHVRGGPPQHHPLSAQTDENRRKRWEAHVNDRERLIAEIKAHLSSNPDLGISALRRPEAKIASHLKQLNWQDAELHRAGVSDRTIAMTRGQVLALSDLQLEVGSRIAARQAARMSKQPKI
ncbi:hypothetical protein [Mesorhizobium helmanticense]|uniref:Uncharacterized protein n=1 Tax=Mesorhizobium helmanticense TaxID=1776423 RepID=A0A2T4IP56_9HYPH|nr:hypothetical protein [Mesorhizobium helmanticense]PTE07390.1 hypothetical protein C9427_27205 [Mesorhizobium helmanticense]